MALGVGISVAIMGVVVGAFLVDSRLKGHIERGIATIPHPWRYDREPSEFEVPLYSPGGYSAATTSRAICGTRPSGDGRVVNLVFGVRVHLYG